MTANKTFMTLGASNHCEHDREENDYYATEPIAIDLLVQSKYVDIPKYIWECACGRGDLSQRLIDYGYKVFSSDLVDRGYGHSGIDFLKTTYIPALENNTQPIKCILTNPPYKLALEFVLHALDLLWEGDMVIMFLKTTFLESQKRYDKLFSKQPPKYVLQFVRRVQTAKNAEFDKMKGGGGSAIAFAWYVWEKGYKGDTIIKWLN